VLLHAQGAAFARRIRIPKRRRSVVTTRHAMSRVPSNPPYTIKGLWTDDADVLSAERRILHAQLSEDVQLRFVALEHGFVFSLCLHVVFFSSTEQQSSGGNCCLTLCPPILQNEERWEMAGRLFDCPAAGPANISRYHRECADARCCMCTCVIHVCVPLACGEPVVKNKRAWAYEICAQPLISR